ncbi:MAG: SDR family oxidoreductase [Burkholderiales bacterium]
MTSPLRLPVAEVPPGHPGPRARFAIVGGRGGVGQRLVSACLRMGHDVAVLDLLAAESSSNDAPKALFIGTDVCDDASVHDAFQLLGRHWDGLDQLVFLVGFSTIPPQSLRDSSLGDWDRIIDGNLRSAYATIRAALPLMDKGHAPSIVLVTSALTLAPQKGYGAYIAAKLGVSGLVKSLAVELAPAIRINAVAPSAMLTPFLAGGSDDPAKRDWFDAKAAAAAIPLGRLCTPDDVVGPILFLSGPAAGFVTGQTLHVSGGRVLP